MATKKILIVDDDRDMLLALNVRLRASGYATVFAADGLSAISTARKENPDVILLDLGLPGGDGFVVLGRLRNLAETATIPVIILTARDSSGNRDRALEVGAENFLQKPVKNELLLATIDKALRRCGPEPEVEV